ncbi:MAG: hypothetical protein ACPHIA_04485 [Alphaproteobacteria bacterium]
MLRSSPFHVLNILGAGIFFVALAFGISPVNAQGVETSDDYRPPDVEIVPVKPLQIKNGTIELSASGCQFVEPEGTAYYLYVTFPRDCPRELRRLTRQMKKDKKERHIQTLTLKPGKYKFEVKNVDVPFAVGLEIYELQSNGKKRSKPIFSEGELLTGYHDVYEIELKEGNYIYTGRQNPTYEYPLVVKP